MLLTTCSLSIVLVVITSAANVAVNTSTFDVGFGGVLLQTMQTRADSSSSTAKWVAQAAVFDEMGGALVQAVSLGEAVAPHVSESTPPPPPLDPVWISPLNNMPAEIHQKLSSKQVISSKANADHSPVQTSSEEARSHEGVVQGSAAAEESGSHHEDEEEYENHLPTAIAEDSGNTSVDANETKKKFQASSPRLARKQIREHNTGCKHGISDHDHHSIFRLKFAEVDSLLFWGIFSGMLAFTLVVDRFESWLSRLASQSRTEMMLLQRTNAELMMFGIVGLGVFVITNVFHDIPTEFFEVFEFTDILCSLGACGVIGIACVLFILRRVMEQRWAVLDQDLSSNEDRFVALNEGVTRDQTMLRQHEFFVMSKRFIVCQKLPKDFSYSSYLKECLALNVCNLMDINALSWIILLSVGVCGFIFKYHYQYQGLSKSSDSMHLFMFCGLVWGTLALFLYLTWEVNSARSSLRIHLGIHSTSETEHQHNEQPDHPKDKFWAWRIRQMTQSLSLFTAFEGAFYIMHVGYNITASGFHSVWKAIVLLPVIFSLCAVLPMVLSRFTLVEAYFTPEHDVIDAVLTKMEEREDDMRYMCKQWIHSGKPNFINVNTTHMYTIMEFSRMLKGYSMQVSQDRQARILMRLDTEGKGVLDPRKLMDKLIEMDKAASPQVTSLDATGAST